MKIILTRLTKEKVSLLLKDMIPSSNLVEVQTIPKKARYSEVAIYL